MYFISTLYENFDVNGNKNNNDSEWDANLEG